MKILAVGLHSGIWVHAHPEDLILRSLARNGNQIVSLRCTGELEAHCVVVSALGHSSGATDGDRETACRRCNQRRRLLQFRSLFTEYRLSDLLDEQTERAINDYIASLGSDSWLDTSFLGVEIGRIASYEVTLEHKLNSLDLDDALLAQVRDNARSAARVASAVDRLIFEERPDALVVYNALYSANRAACLVAVRHGVPAWAMHAGLNLEHRFSQMYLYPHDTLPGFSYLDPTWDRVKALPASTESMRMAVDHFLQLLKATNRFVYSSAAGTHTAAGVRAALDIAPDAKVVVATLSSEDEMMAARTVGLSPPVVHNPTFDSVHDWLEHLISHVSRKTGAHLVIRVHPREFPNKRETKLSANAQRLKHLFSALPANVTVNWPDDGISLYDLAQVMDVCANYTSSAGVEMMLLGIPAVTPRAPFMAAYDPELSYFVAQRDDYGAQLDRALENGWSIENTRRALRWWAHMLADLPIDISDGFSYPAGGFVPASAPGRRSTRAALIGFAARHAPPVLEIKHVLGRRDLKDAARVEAVLRGSHTGRLDNACGANLDEENAGIATALVPIVNELESTWGPEVGPLAGLSAFVRGGPA